MNKQVDMNDLDEETKKNVLFIRNQTNYSVDECLIKLKEHENNTTRVIREYLGLPLEEKKNIIKSVLNNGVYESQVRYELMRNFYDEVYTEYEKRKDDPNYLEEKKEKLKNIQCETLNMQKNAKITSEVSKFVDISVNGELI